MSAATDAAKAALAGHQSLGSDVALKQANQEYGVGESQTHLSALKGLVGKLQSSVEAVDPSVTGRTSGTFTTEGQRQALVNKERAPIMSDLNKQQGAYSDEQQTLTQKQSLASQMASALLNDDKTKYQKLLDQYNASVAQDKFDFDKQQAEAQKQQWAQQFAESQKQFQQTLAANKASAASKGGGGSSTPSTSQFLVQAFSGYDPKKMKNYTEKEVIPALMANYNLSKDQAAKLAYQYRKAVYNE